MHIKSVVAFSTLNTGFEYKTISTPILLLIFKSQNMIWNFMNKNTIFMSILYIFLAYYKFALSHYTKCCLYFSRRKLMFVLRCSIAIKLYEQRKHTIYIRNLRRSLCVPMYTVLINIDNE